MEKRIMFYYDKKGDVLDISIGKPRKAVSEEVTDDVVVRLDPKTENIVGFTIINFSTVFLKKVSDVKRPIEINA